MILLTDSYKLSHWSQYPPGLTWLQSYFESRGGEYQDIVFFGLQYLLARYLSEIPSSDEIVEAQNLAEQHGVPFNRAGWERILSLKYLPVRIHSVPEGSIWRPHDVLMTVESTDRQTAWIATWLETLLMKVWYPCTVATKAYYVRQIILDAYRRAGIKDGMEDMANADFAYHNFGDRGSSSVETAAVGGAAHLTQFLGTDNFASLDFVNQYYGVAGGCPGYSIPASEHSTVTTWGPDREHEMIENYVDQNRGRPMIACVLDSYDLFESVRFCCADLKHKIESDEYPILVMRPDSGDPLRLLPQILEVMTQSGLRFTTRNGLKTFVKYRILWGDGITPDVIREILSAVMDLGYSPQNLAFGSGGDLMQKLNRDTCQFALKCCAVVTVAGGEQPVFKKPLHDAAKASAAGRKTLPAKWLRFENGALVHQVTFDDIRRNSRA